MCVGRAVIHPDQFAGCGGHRVTEHDLDSRFPPGVAHGAGAAGDDQLTRHEIVVGDRIGREMRQVAEPEGAQAVAGS